MYLSLKFSSFGNRRFPYKYSFMFSAILIAVLRDRLVQSVRWFSLCLCSTRSVCRDGGDQRVSRDSEGDPDREGFRLQTNSHL